MILTPKKGRPEKYGPKDIEMMKALIERGTPIKDIAEKWGVSRTTIYRYLEYQNYKIIF